MNANEELQLDRWSAEVDQVLKGTTKYKGGFIKWLANCEKKMQTSVKSPHFFSKLIIEKFNLPIEYDEEHAVYEYNGAEEGRENHLNILQRYTSIFDVLHSFAQGFITIRPTYDDLNELAKYQFESPKGSELRFTNNNFLIQLPANSGFRARPSEFEVEEIYVRVLRGQKAAHLVRRDLWGRPKEAFDERLHIVLHVILVKKGDSSQGEKPNTELMQELFIQIGPEDRLQSKASETIYYSHKGVTEDYAPHKLLSVLFNLLHDLNRYSYRERQKVEIYKM